MTACRGRAGDAGIGVVRLGKITAGEKYCAGGTGATFAAGRSARAGGRLSIPARGVMGGTTGIGGIC